MPTGRPDDTSSAPSAAAWAQHQVLDLIGDGSLQAGQRLPAERDLATRLGVSRASAREAISALVTLGVLEARHGAGVYVTALDPVTLLSGFAPVLSIIAEKHAQGLVRLHTEIEASAAARAAARAATADAGPLRQALEELRLADIEPLTRHAEDRFRTTIWHLSDERFHRAVAHLAQDPVAEGMTALLRTTRARLTDVEPAHDLAGHERLAQAIAERDPLVAAAVARQLVEAEFALPADPPATTDPAAPGASSPGPGAALVTSRAEPPAGHADPSRTPEWFRDAKLGLIVHWGVYSVPGWAPLEHEERVRGSSDDDRHTRPQHPFAEWYQASAALSGSRTAEHHRRVHGGKDYADFRLAFEDALRTWDPQTWVSQFAGAGARYVVQVAKHHDGFLMWPSRVRHPNRSDWRASRDVVGEVAAAAREAGLRYGIFYSSGIDWSFNAVPPAELADVLTSSPPGVDYARYVEAQWRELIEGYHPDGLWNDTGYPAAGDAPRLLRSYDAIVPDGVVSDRFRVPTMDVTDLGALSRAAVRRPRESIRPLGLSFGWNRQETAADVLSGPELVLLLMDVVTTDRNLLLGVSPDDRGNLPDAQAESLAALGGWLAVHGDAVYATTPWRVPRMTTTHGRQVFLTQRPDALYVTVEGAVHGDLTVEGLRLDDDAEVTLLHAPGVHVTHRHGDRGSVVHVPTDAPAEPVATVLRVTPLPRA